MLEIPATTKSNRKQQELPAIAIEHVPLGAARLTVANSWEARSSRLGMAWEASLTMLFGGRAGVGFQGDAVLLSPLLHMFLPATRLEA